MSNYIPTGFDPSAGQQQSDNNDFNKHIFEQGEEVNFFVHKVSHKTWQRTFKNEQLSLPDCEMWSFQLIIKDNTGTNSNMVFLDVVKDARAWHCADKNGRKWIQNKFINMLTGMGLRSSKEQLNLNPGWFTDANYYTGVTGRLKVDKVIDNKTNLYKNEVSWFVESKQAEQQQQPQQQNMFPPANGASVETYQQPQQGISDEQVNNGMPF